MKTPTSRPILIYFELRSNPSLITVICKDPHSPNKLFATKYLFLILEDDISFFFIVPLFFVYFLLFYAILCYFVIINFYKNCYYYYFIIFFFMKTTFIFSCSWIFRDVPCSGFYRRPGRDRFVSHLNKTRIG